MSKATIEVLLSLSIEEAVAVRDRLADDKNPQTDSAYEELTVVLAGVGE